MKRARLSLIAIVPMMLSFSCGDDGDGTGNDAGSTDDAAAAITPQSGNWVYDSYSVTRNECGVMDDQIPGVDSGGFLLSVLSATTFTVRPDAGGGDPFDCTLTGATFSCPDRQSLDEDIPALMITLSASTDAQGEFTTNEDATGTQLHTISCTGTGCPAVETNLGVTFPCEVEVAFVSSFLGL